MTDTKWFKTYLLNEFTLILTLWIGVWYYCSTIFTQMSIPINGSCLHFIIFGIKSYLFSSVWKKYNFKRYLNWFYEFLPYFKHRVSCMFCQANCIDLEVDLFPRVYFFKNWSKPDTCFLSSNIFSRHIHMHLFWMRCLPGVISDITGSTLALSVIRKCCWRGSTPGHG